MPIGGPIISFVNLFGLGWLGTTIGYAAMGRFLLWILFFALFQGLFKASFSPSFIREKKRVSSVLALSISLLTALGIPSAVVISLLSGFGIIGAILFVILIVAGYAGIIRNIPSDGEEDKGHITAKLFLSLVTVAVLSAFEAATASATGMPPGVINSYNEVLSWAILIPTVMVFVYLYRLFTHGDDDEEETQTESASTAERKRANRFKFVESRLLRAREYLEEAERHAGDWDDANKKQKSQQALTKARREVHQAWTQLRRVRRSDREVRDMANNFAARTQVYENMIDDLIRINGRRP